MILTEYFDVVARPNQSCELFLVEEVPAAAMLYSQNDSRGVPVVEAFHINKALLLVFDAGTAMRAKLFDRYHRLSIENATNKRDFLAWP